MFGDGRSIPIVPAPWHLLFHFQGFDSGVTVIHILYNMVSGLERAGRFTPLFMYSGLTATNKRSTRSFLPLRPFSRSIHPNGRSRPRDFLKSAAHGWHGDSYAHKLVFFVNNQRNQIKIKQSEVYVDVMFYLAVGEGGVLVEVLVAVVYEMEQRAPIFVFYPGAGRVLQLLSDRISFLQCRRCGCISQGYRHGTSIRNSTQSESFTYPWASMCSG